MLVNAYLASKRAELERHSRPPLSLCLYLAPELTLFVPALSTRRQWLHLQLRPDAVCIEAAADSVVEHGSAHAVL